MQELAKRWGLEVAGVVTGVVLTRQLNQGAERIRDKCRVTGAD